MSDSQEEIIKEEVTPRPQEATPKTLSGDPFEEGVKTQEAKFKKPRNFSPLPGQSWESDLYPYFSVRNTPLSVEESLKYFRDNRHSLECCQQDFTDFYQNFDNPSWEEADLKFLLHYMVDFETKGMSSTIKSLYTIIRTWEQTSGKKIFLDVSFFPCKTNDYHKICKKGNIRMGFGRMSSKPMEDFDVIGFSHSICAEALNVPLILWHGGMNILKENRMKTNEPLLIMGGVSAQMSEYLYGDIKYKNPEGVEETHRGIIDATCIGDGEVIFPDLLSGLCENIDKWKVKGEDHRLHKEETLLNLYKHFPLSTGYFEGEKWIAEWIDHDKGIQKTTRLNVEKYSELEKFYPDGKIKKYFIETDNFDDVPNMDMNVFHAHSQSVSSDIIISKACTPGGNCSFCIEGSSSGRWREKSLDNVLKAMERSHIRTAADEGNAFSFNFSYYSEFPELIMETAKIYGSETFMSQRTDMIASYPVLADYQGICGSRQVTLALEGVSERIRNYFNKVLTFEEICIATEHFIKKRYTEIKFYCIASGMETAEDSEELERLCRHMNYCKLKYGSPTTLRWSFTTLNMSPYTALRWAPMTTVERMIHQKPVNSLGDILEILYQHNMRVRTSGRLAHSLFTQVYTFCDRRFTQASMEFLFEGLRHPTDWACKDKEAPLFEYLVRKAGINLEEYVKEKPEDFIFPTDYIDIVKTKKYFYRIYKNCVGNVSTNYCLRTLANQKPNCLACGYCKDKKTIKRQTHRRLPDISKIDPNGLISIIRDRNRVKHRLLFKTQITNPEYRVISRVSQSRAVGTSFLQVMEGKEHDGYTFTHKDFVRVLGSTRDKCESSGFFDWIYGEMHFVIEMKERIDLDWIKSLIPEMNKVINKGFIINDVRDFEYERMPKSSPYWSLYRAELKGHSNTADFFDSMSNLEKSIKLKKKKEVTRSKMQVFEYDADWEPKLVVPAWGKNRQGEDALFLYFQIPTSVNPYLFLEAIGLKGKSLYKNIILCMGEFLEESILTGKETDYCDVCSKPVEQTSFSRKPVGRKCLYHQIKDD